VQPLFTGSGSLREPSERISFWMTALLSLPAALLIGYVLHESIGASQVALFIVLAMVYVTLARGRLLGSSVRVHERQYPRVFTIVKAACAALEIPMPLIFVREDNYVPVVALGFGEPYALVLSSHWIELFADDELSFMIGRELGHIAAGHTRFHSLLSVNGNENPIVSLIFGAWLRRCALTCDKVGLLCCGSLDAAIRAMGIAAFHEFGRRVDYEAFAEQDAEIQADSVLRWGSWLSSEPYATQRIASLRRFIVTGIYANAEEWFLRERSEEPPALAAPGAFRVTRNDCAGWWRRFAAFSIDGVIVTAIITSFGGSVVSSSTRGAAVRVAGQNVPINIDALATYIGNAIAHLGVFLWLPIYLAVLVILAGQTFGMMIAGLRVVTIDYGKPSILRTIARYFIVFALWPVIMLLSLVWRRELLHDRWTKTRVVMVERVVARITGTA
jgi:Zn-dependent protease with chaperone function/uncharacterized RDD family membrane protein YckC